MASADSFFSRLNPLISALLRSPMHGLASRGLVLIGVTGRRSGRRYQIPVGYQQFGDVVLILVSEAPRKNWWRNYEDPAEMELLLRGRRVRGMAHHIDPEAAEFGERWEATLRRARQLGRIFGIRFDPAVGLSPEALEKLRRESAMVRVDLEPQA